MGYRKGTLVYVDIPSEKTWQAHFKTDCFAYVDSHEDEDYSLLLLDDEGEIMYGVSWYDEEDLVVVQERDGDALIRIADYYDNFGDTYE